MCLQKVGQGAFLRSAACCGALHQIAVGHNVNEICSFATFHYKKKETMHHIAHSQHIPVSFHFTKYIFKKKKSYICDFDFCAVTTIVIPAFSVIETLKFYNAGHMETAVNIFYFPILLIQPAAPHSPGNAIHN